jgi:uncharacterized protein YpmB
MKDFSEYQIDDPDSDSHLAIGVDQITETQAKDALCDSIDYIIALENLADSMKFLIKGWEKGKPISELNQRDDNDNDSNADDCVDGWR